MTAHTKTKRIPMTAGQRLQFEMLKTAMKSEQDNLDVYLRFIHHSHSGDHKFDVDVELVIHEAISWMTDNMARSQAVVFSQQGGATKAKKTILENVGHNASHIQYHRKIVWDHIKKSEKARGVNEYHYEKPPSWIWYFKTFYEFLKPYFTNQTEETFAEWDRETDHLMHKMMWVRLAVVRTVMEMSQVK